MSFNSLYLCPLGLTAELNFNISKTICYRYFQNLLTNVKFYSCYHNVTVHQATFVTKIKMG